jgi:hypothetical protein
MVNKCDGCGGETVAEKAQALMARFNEANDKVIGSLVARGFVPGDFVLPEYIQRWLSIDPGVELSLTDKEIMNFLAGNTPDENKSLLAKRFAVTLGGAMGVADAACELFAESTHVVQLQKSLYAIRTLAETRWKQLPASEQIVIDRLQADMRQFSCQDVLDSVSKQDVLGAKQQNHSHLRSRMKGFIKRLTEERDVEIGLPMGF